MSEDLSEEKKRTFAAEKQLQLYVAELTITAHSKNEHLHRNQKRAAALIERERTTKTRLVEKYSKDSLKHKRDADLFMAELYSERLEKLKSISGIVLLHFIVFNLT